jgi:CBS domain-containing protein
MTGFTMTGFTRSPRTRDGGGTDSAGPRSNPVSPRSGPVVRDFMKRPSMAVPGSATVAEAIRLLTGAHVGGAPVMAGDHVIGVVTLADLHRWITESDPDRLEEPARALRSLGMRLDRVAVDRLLPRLAIKARHDWPADHALGVLTRAGIQRLPVVDADGRLVGVIAREALLAAGIEAPPGGRHRAVPKHV